MSGENWESLITEKGFMRVPRALRLKRAELGITNNEYTILLDYVDYYSFSGTMNPYRHLTEVSGMNERSIRRILTSLENKGLLKRVVNQHGNGRTKGVVFSIAPLVRRLKTVMKKMSPTVGEEIVPYVGEESVPPNTGEEFNKRDEDKNTSAKNTDVRARGREDVRMTENEDHGKSVVRGEGIKDESGERLEYHGFIRGTGGPCQEAARNDGRPAREGDAETEGVEAGQIHLARAGKGPHGPVTGEDGKKGAYSPSRWYNEVWRGLYEEAAGQPALTGGREYRAADMYFRRLRELNPEMEPAEVYELAGEGAAFMIASQLEGGVFGWMHKPPDICLLASQAQSVEWHLRKMRRAALQQNNSGETGKSPPSYPHARQIGEHGHSLPRGLRVRASYFSLARSSPLKGEGINDCNATVEESETSPVFVKFIEKIREVQDAGQQIERVYGELREIERAARPRALRRGRG